MAWKFHKRVRLGKITYINLSKTGISFSQKVGQVITINSRGYLTFSIPKTGLSYTVKLFKLKG
ncbi:DUF4236 domain-containing protein [Turicibacter sanguinis]|uniref:DUF4236 domain-containing protein n=1 Tax=Turicibacter sanguinis TaxID=154288 RepID=UPI0021D4883C|nr:DUF4236 domain-containing protein [Turicibacter sanguinis]MCU7197977.1 DUF4236 domain-containing protein [Turicibacter sanguinis]MDB8576094.1 DUF4236 domain-containing protein [Turicibacter sanguinis]MDB8578899.1 DUF4236 domain-containing protein [Turicibacter sanguinis]MDB8584712.1 DUF4236 domain-containing protein [Turicibacter sanguinis]MDB8587659.1 DUF4236 domain-containing protein [Turicibacter sanguinis]